MSKRGSRSVAEWVSFLASLTVIVVIIGLIAVQIPGSDDPAAPVARLEGVESVGDAFHVRVAVRNEGDVTAVNVQVSAELTIEGETLTGDQTIDFLSGSQQQSLTFVFDQDPAAGELTVSVTGFAAP